MLVGAEYNEFMKTNTFAPQAEVGVWLRILRPDGNLSPEVARAILRLSFPQADKKRMHDLSAKARAGTLSRDEETEMDVYERAGAILSILKSKARLVVKETHRER